MKQLFNFLSRKKRVSNNSASESIEARIYSQPHALNVYMHQSSIKHGELVEANLKCVRVVPTNDQGEPKESGPLTVFFCPLAGIEVLQRLSPGDDREIPSTVKVHNLRAENGQRPGIYNLKNVLLYANGTINVMATKTTTLEWVQD